MKLTRRTLLAAAPLGIALSSTSLASSVAPNLGAVGAANGISFGSAFDSEIFSDPDYRKLIADNCRIATIENALKFDWLRRTGPKADFTKADKLIAFANDAKIPVRGSALIWNDWAPRWLSSYSAQQIGAIMDRHIDETIGRYAGRMQGWDVVNEPFYPPHHRTGGYRKGPWFDELGPGYIDRAFRRAAAADPKAKLVLNEAFCEQDDELGRSVRARLLDLVSDLKHAGIKLDAVGFQGHLKPHLPFDDAAFAAYLQKIADLDVDIYITEFDVNDSSFPDDIATRDRMVAERCSKFLRSVLSVPRVKTVICWHLSDRYSWYKNTDWYAAEIVKFGGTATRPVRTHLADAAHQPKDAWNAVADVMAGKT